MLISVYHVERLHFSQIFEAWNDNWTIILRLRQRTLFKFSHRSLERRRERRSIRHNVVDTILPRPLVSTKINDSTRRLATTTSPLKPRGGGGREKSGEEGKNTHGWAGGWGSKRVAMSFCWGESLFFPPLFARHHFSPIVHHLRAREWEKPDSCSNELRFPWK